MNADNSQSGAAGANQQVAAQGAPIFTILAGVFVFVCFVTPLILLTIPVMLTLAMSLDSSSSPRARNYPRPQCRGAVE
jgi:hypothetical protein